MPPKRHLDDPALPAPAARSRTTRSQSNALTKDENHHNGRKTQTTRSEGKEDNEVKKPRETRQAARKKAADVGPTATDLPPRSSIMAKAQFQQDAQARDNATQPIALQGGSASDMDNENALAFDASGLPGPEIPIDINFSDAGYLGKAGRPHVFMHRQRTVVPKKPSGVRASSVHFSPQTQSEAVTRNKPSQPSSHSLPRATRSACANNNSQVPVSTASESLPDYSRSRSRTRTHSRSQSRSHTCSRSLSRTPRPSLNADISSPVSSTEAGLGVLEEYILRTGKGQQDALDRQVYRQQRNLQKGERGAQEKVVPHQDQDEGVPGGSSVPHTNRDVGHSDEDIPLLNDGDEVQTGDETDATGAEINSFVDELLESQRGGSVAGDSQDDGASSFSTQEDARLKKKNMRRSRGKEVSDTDEEDREAEDEMLQDIVPELDSPVVSRSSTQKKRLTAKQKGKARRVDPPSGCSGDEEEESEGEVIKGIVPSNSLGSPSRSSAPKKRLTAKQKGKAHCADPQNQEDGAAGPHVRGMLSAEARAEAQQLGSQTQVAVSALAKKYNKPYHSILVAAGLDVQSARRQNFSNLFKKWYKAHIPMEESMSFAEYRDQIHAAYSTYREEYRDNREEADQEITDYCNQLATPYDGFESSTKSVVAHMQSAKTQFTNLAQSWWNMYGVAIIGAVIYVGTDAGGRQSSTVFSGAPKMKGVLEKNLTNVTKIVDQLTTAFKAEEMNENGGLLQASPQQDPIFDIATGKRDRNKKVVGKYLIEELQALIEGQSDHFPWSHWCEFAYRNQVCLRGWSRNILPPGPQFNNKNTISTDGWNDLAGRIPASWRENPLRNDKLPEMRIVRWTDGQCQLAAAGEGGDIPLVCDGSEKPLRLAKDTKEYYRHLDSIKPKKSKQRLKCPSQDDSSDSDDMLQSPLSPAGAGPSTRSNEASHSRKHAVRSNSSDIQYDGPQSPPLRQTDAIAARPRLPLPTRAHSIVLDNSIAGNNNQRPMKRKRLDADDAIAVAQPSSKGSSQPRITTQHSSRPTLRLPFQVPQTQAKFSSGSSQQTAMEAPQSRLVGSSKRFATDTLTSQQHRHHVPPSSGLHGITEDVGLPRRRYHAVPMRRDMDIYPDHAGTPRDVPTFRRTVSDQPAPAIRRHLNGHPYPQQRITSNTNTLHPTEYQRVTPMDTFVGHSDDRIGGVFRGPPVQMGPAYEYGEGYMDYEQEEDAEVYDHPARYNDWS